MGVNDLLGVTVPNHGYNYPRSATQQKPQVRQQVQYDHDGRPLKNYVVNDERSDLQWTTSSAPLLLLSISRDATRNGAPKFTFNPAAKQYLEEEVAGRPVIIVTVCGMYRSGKSFLLNCLCGKDGNNSFRVGSTVNACTDGIWMWASGETSDGRVVLMLDCEGSGNVQKDRAHDTQLFAVAVLLSSFFIYNSKGVIDEPAIQSLSVVTNLAAQIQAQQNVIINPPFFLWLLRDFCLQLEDGQGREITSDDYLELAFTDRSGGAWRQSEDGRQAREKLVSLFRQRGCSTLVQPVIEEEELQVLSSLPLGAMRREFQDQMAALKQRIFRSAQVKTVGASVVSGVGLTTLVEVIVESINSGKIPQIASTWSAVCAVEIEKALELATRRLLDAMRALRQNLPFSESGLEQALVETADAAHEVFRERVFGDEQLTDRARQSLASIVEEEAGQIVIANENAAREYCQQLVLDMWRPVGRAVQRRQYKSKEDLEKAITDEFAQYHQRARGPENIVDHVLEDFLHIHRAAAERDIEERDRKSKADQKVFFIFCFNFSIKQHDLTIL